MSPADVAQCSVEELAECLANASACRGITLLDVREDWERKLAAIDGAVTISMYDVPDRLDEIRAAQGANKLVIFCHTGKRSMTIARFLQQNGFERVVNLTGGINAWTQQIDRSAHLY